MEKLIFTPIQLSDCPPISALLAQMDSVSCEMNIGNLFMWREQAKNVFTAYRNRIIVAAQVEEVMFFPLGEWLSPAELAEVTAQVNPYINNSGTIYDVPPEYLAAYPEINEFFQVEQSADYADYIYDLTDLAELRGAKLRKKRNLIKQFTAANPNVKIGEITPDNIDEFYQLSQELFGRLAVNDTLQKELEMWPEVHHYLFAPELNMGSLTLSLDNRMIGFAIYSPLGQHAYDIHFEKVDHTIKGAPQFLVQELAKKLLTLGGRLMNREQDLGLPGLRQAKESLAPLYLYQRAILRSRG